MSHTFDRSFAVVGRFDRYLADGATAELRRVARVDDEPAIADEGAACVADEMVADPRFVPSLAAGMVGERPSEGAEVTEIMARAVAACPSVLADVMASVFEDGTGIELDDSARACLQEAASADPDAVATAILGDEAARAVNDQALAACLTGLAGVPAGSLASPAPQPNRSPKTSGGPVAPAAAVNPEQVDTSGLTRWRSLARAPSQREEVQRTWRTPDPRRWRWSTR